ncbi:MAG: AAA family ATPase, partial [Myxococcota bacterium]
MRLLRLQIDQLPGIDQGFSLEDLSSGVNLVTGPNATGKSSILRALAYLLGGQRRGDPLALSLTADLEGQQGRYRVRRLGSQIVWELDGRAVARPSIPAADRLHCYLLSMEELVSVLDDHKEGDHKDRALIHELRKALGGGFDLEGLKAALRVGPKVGRREAKGLQEAAKKLRAVEREHEALRGEEAELGELAERMGCAREAAERAYLLKKALELLQARAERSRLDRILDDFPAEMELLDGKELERLTRLESRMEEHREELASARARR